MLAIIVIIIMAFFLYKINTEGNTETEKADNLTNEVNSLESKSSNVEKEKIKNFLIQNICHKNRSNLGLYNNIGDKR